MSDAQAAKLVGTLVADRYRVVRKLAAGGMGVVFLAEQVPLGRQVALKILDTQQLDADRARNFGERFFLEAAAVARLQHPNTITVYDFGKTLDEVYYYAMEFVDGASLGQHVHAKGPLDARGAIHVGLQICGSLHEAHLAGLIHRDLKPGNVMLTSRLGDPLFVKVLDFGLVKVMGGEEVEASDLTQSGMLLGSPRYMAPEQVLRGELDARCDIYALGGVLYHTLSGFPPFRHGSQFEVLRAQVEERPAPLTEVYPFCKATPRLEAVVMRCLEKDPRARFQSMSEVAAELVECARELGLDTSLGGALRGQVSSPSHSVPPELRAPMEAPSSGGSLVVSPSASGYADPATGASAPTATAEPPPRSGAAWILVALGALALLAAGAGVFVAVAFFGMAADPIAERTPAPVAPPITPVEPPVEPPPQVPTVEAPPPEVVADSVRPASVRLETEPTGARVRRGDVDLGDAPFSVTIPDGEAWELTFSLAGHESRTVLVTSGRDALHVRLLPSPAEPTTSRRRPPVTPTPPPPPVVTGPREPPPRFQNQGDLRHPWGP